jgi:hypothetical protein
MADSDGSHLNLGSPVAPRGRGRPRGSKNKSNTSLAAAGSSSAVLAKRRLDRPPGSKNKPKVTGAALGPITPLPTAPPRIFSFFCIAMAQCREIQRLPLNFTKFMDGRELREVVLCERLFSANSLAVVPHDIHQGFFMAFDFHIGTSKFDVKIYDGTQCQKKLKSIFIRICLFM